MKKFLNTKPMAWQRLITGAFAVGLLFVSAATQPAQAKTLKFTVPNNGQTTTTDTVTRHASVAKTPAAKPAEKNLPAKINTYPADSHFTWGFEAGASLDMTSNDLTTFDVDMVLGYRNSIFNLIGVGAGIHRSAHINNSFIPVYAIFRTDFRKERSPLFMNVTGGYSFNNVEDSETLGDFYGSAGLGVNLSQSHKVKTYVILSMAYQYFSDRNLKKIRLDKHYIFFAKLNFGINF